MASRRLQRIVGQLAPNTSGSMAQGQRGNSDDDIVVVSALRTAIGKARGILQDTNVEDLLAGARAVVQQSRIDPSMIGDVVVGSVLGNAACQRVPHRCFMAGLPAEVPVHIVNRQCSSGCRPSPTWRPTSTLVTTTWA